MTLEIDQYTERKRPVTNYVHVIEYLTTRAEAARARSKEALQAYFEAQDALHMAEIGALRAEISGEALQDSLPVPARRNTKR
jgi:hypothetical protein